MMNPQQYLILLSMSRWMLALASDCNGDASINFTCPAKGGFYCEEANSLGGSIILRCIDGCPVPGNCNDDLFCYPAGTGDDKQDAFCYQDSPTAGNGQCTYNCVNVTKVDGSVFYPLGCVSSALASETYGASYCASLGVNGSTLGLPSGIIQTATTSAASLASQITITSTGVGTGPTATATKSDGSGGRPQFWNIAPILGLLASAVLF